MRSFAASLAIGFVVTAMSGEALAQKKPARSSSQFTLRREDPGGSDGAAARQRARAGDCAGALPHFDAAVRSTVDPSLRRDRGLCHEKLGNPYPAIDDYRAYLMDRPDAADADQIRDRLARLEDQVAGREGGSREKTKSDDSPSKEKSGYSASASMSASTEDGPSATSSSSSSSSSAAARGDMKSSGKDYDEVAEEERRADYAEDSPLRYGEGFIIGPYVQVPRFLFADGDKLNGGTMSTFGVTLRYSFGPTLTFVGDVGYARLPLRITSSVAGGGPQLFAGLEARIPISRFASDQILVGGGAGYEYYSIPIVVSSVESSASVHYMVARARAGYRHVFGARIGVEAIADGGPGILIPGDGESRLGLVIGGAVALVIGF